MTPAGTGPVVINGWTLFVHPLFVAQVSELIAQVEELRKRWPDDYRDRRASRRLAAISKLAFDVIPRDPASAQWRLGGSLGELHTHWRRARFFQQYRLFFRFHTASRTIIYAWVNDERTLRAFESPDDAYRVFARMLDRGHPAGDWDALLRESSTDAKALGLRAAGLVKGSGD
ncbi:MAG: type II toxin-antitoxin system YhaV family toxin [Pseudomonadota bacterium]